MHIAETAAAFEPRRSPRPTSVPRPWTAGWSRPALVEVALVSMAFLVITLGAIDIGRAVYEYHALTNAVHDGARFGRADPPNTAGIKDAVISSAPALGLTYDHVATPTCAGGCSQGSPDVTVSASKRFVPVIATLLGVSEDFPIMLSSTVTVEA